MAEPGKLGKRIDLISGIAMHESGEKANDILGRAYEYFLGSFACSQGKRGGEIYTLCSVVGVPVEMSEPYVGWVYDPRCGSGGKFVQSEKSLDAHAGKLVDIGSDRHPDFKAVYGIGNPAFNDSDWRGEFLKGDLRWVYGRPPVSNFYTLGDATQGPRP